ncbi:MAG TPA: neutral zinc metallopeptidase [Pseudonocardiaceae bacterium]|nr:neutral zinc metallopeptidase [Pseudonocardiaceae bacterium]
MRSATLLAALLVAVLVLSGCSVIISGRAVSGDGVMTRPADTSIVQGSDGSPVDELSTATLVDVQSYWRAAFEPAFGRPWRDISGGFFSVDTSDPQAPPPPCLEASVQLEGNAFYCAGADAIAWDRAALLPVLREQYGDGGVVVVLAHEFGHAVHHRLGVDPSGTRGGGSTYPTILTEAMADCYAGSFVRWVADGNAEHLQIDQQELDRALSALVTFRDPVGTSSKDIEAHGNAFDRVSAFQDGYQQGPRLCANFTVANRNFTQQRFTSYEDLALEGNLPFHRLISVITPDLDRYFGELVTIRGGQWRPPQVLAGEQRRGCSTEQGPAAFCPDEDAIELDSAGQLPRLHAEIGDYATGTLLASRYSLAALDALGKPTEGESAGREALCLAGTYTGTLLQRKKGFGLSPGDLDEAVQVLLGYDYGSRDAAGASLPSGFARVGDFRAGTLDGVGACGL